MFAQPRQLFVEHPHFLFVRQLRLFQNHFLPLQSASFIVCLFRVRSRVRRSLWCCCSRDDTDAVVAFFLSPSTKSGSSSSSTTTPSFSSVFFFFFFFFFFLGFSIAAVPFSFSLPPTTFSNPISLSLSLSLFFLFWQKVVPPSKRKDVKAAPANLKFNLSLFFFW